MAAKEFTVAIALGSNIGAREEFIAQGLKAIAERIGSISARSQLIETAALVLPEYQGPPVGSYLNMVVTAETALEPIALLEELLSIELDLGRRRAEEVERWMSRVIDLDLIFYESLEYSSDKLTIPHPEMHKRDFVLGPLVEIAPHWIHPRFKKTVEELYSALLLS